MGQNYNKTSREIIGALQYPGEFRWHKKASSHPCKAKNIGLDSFVKCLEKDAYSCPFSVRYGYSYYCRCHHADEMAKRLAG